LPGKLHELEMAYATRGRPSVQAMDGFSLEVREGELLTLIGPSGCGKTSVLRALGGLVSPATGGIEIYGDRVRGPLPDRVAYVFQDFNA
jgi:NitT/TauT family transport system ATP-binding protein